MPWRTVRPSPEAHPLQRPVGHDRRHQRIAEQPGRPARARTRPRGVDVDARLRLALRLAERLTDPAVASSLEVMLATLLGRAMERLTSPEALELLAAVLSRLDAVRGVLESGVLDPATTKVVGTAGQALVRTARERIDDGPGALGVLRALGDGDVRAAVGFTLRFARHFGRSLKEHGLTLPARAP